jgi:endonuclease/exonuclease/phosphatase family metal-dependent hydrolase
VNVRVDMSDVAMGEVTRVSGGRSRAGVLGGGLAALVGLGCLVVPGAVAAGSVKLATPTGERVVRVSASSFSVVTNVAANARRYRLFASTTKGDLWVKNIGRARRSALSAKPEVSLSGLPYTTKPYFYRIEALNGTHHRFSPEVREVGLRPAEPSHLRLARRADGAYLTWSSTGSTGFSVTRATDPAMTRNVHTYRVLGDTHQFTPPAMARGRTYYFQVRALNDATRSLASAPMAVAARASQQPIQVMTYNILELTTDGRREGTGVIAPWSQRRLAAAALIKKANPDVIAIQEGAAWVGRPRGARQIDSLRSALGGEYALSHTEVSPSQPHYFRTGVYILYKKSAYKAVGHSWHWALGNAHWAAYQILQNRKTHAKVLFVSLHLQVGNYAVNDRKRENETKTLLRKAGAFAASHHVPVIYAGDFNTDVNAHHAFDGPGIAMREADVASAFNAAQKRRYANYNSANGYNRQPPRFGDHIDYIYASPGVAVLSWRQVMRLSHGRLVGVIPSDHNPVVAGLEFPY